MRESSTYQAILAEGEERGLAKGEALGIAKGGAEMAKRLLLRTGSIRFGAPNAAVTSALEAITDPDDLARLVERVVEVESWQELLAR